MNIDGKEVSMEQLKKDVEMNKGIFDPEAFTFTTGTVEALLNKVEELEGLNENLICEIRDAVR